MTNTDQQLAELSRIEQSARELPISGGREQLDLVTIAFNNPQIIDVQISQIKQHMRDPYQLCVADNSSQPYINEISAIAKHHGVNYLRLPENPFTQPKDASASHGYALICAFHLYVQPRGLRWFGFLDHDIFPFRPTSILWHLSSYPLYGFAQDRNEKWYLWPGFCFFELRLFDGIKANFMPKDGTDTGGGNWELVYSKFNRRALPAHSYTTAAIDPSEPLHPQLNSYETIGDWVHTFNASHWLPGPTKEDKIPALFKRLRGTGNLFEVDFKEIATAQYAEGALLRDDFPGFKEDYLTIHSLIRRFNPKSFAEIGTSNGRGTSVVCQAFKAPLRSAVTNESMSRIFSLDVPPGTDPKKIYPGGEDGHPSTAGSDCPFAYRQLFGFSNEFDFSPYYPLEGWFVDGKHNYEYALKDSLQAFRANPKLVIWHDMQIDGVAKAVEELEPRYPEFLFVRVRGTRVAFAVKREVLYSKHTFGAL